MSRITPLVAIAVIVSLTASVASEDLRARDVRIVNTQGEPIPVIGRIAAPVVEPFQASLAVTIPGIPEGGEVPVEGAVSFFAPVEKRLRIDYITCHSPFTSVAPFRVFVETSVAGVMARHLVLATLQPNTMTRIFADAGTEVRFIFENNGRAPSNATVTVSGELLASN